MDTVLEDARLALRRLLKAPGFTALVVVTLGLGIGANTAAFGVVGGALFGWSRAYERASELVMVWQRKGDDRWSPTPADFRDWQARSSVFAGLAAYHYRTVNVSGEGEAARASAAYVSATMFELLGVKPLLGRAFLPGEDEWGRHRVVVLSQGLWRRAFGADPSVIGREVRIDGEPLRVIGVLPAGTWFSATPVDLWRPLAFAPGDPTNDRNSHYLNVVGRLRPGTTLHQSRTAMDTLAGQLEREYPQNDGLGVAVVPLAEAVLGDVRPALLILMGAVGLVLLAACANVANLLLARAAGRSREFAVRLALGAGRGRLVRQLLTESLLLSLAGGALGLLLASWGGDLAAALVPRLPRLAETGIPLDGPVLAFAVLISALTGILFGLAPALQASSANLTESLAEGGRGGSGGRRTGRARNALVVSELALAALLLAGAGLLVRSFIGLQHVDPGVRDGQLLTMSLSLPESRSLDDTYLRSFFEQVIERVEALPGVEAAGVSSHRPLGGGGMSRHFAIDGSAPPRSLADVPTISARQESARSLQALGMPLVKGRLFGEQDDEGSPRVAVVNQALVRRFFPGEDPIGRQILLEAPEAVLAPDQLPPGGRWARWTVVGIVGDVRYRGLSDPPEAVAYVPYRQRTKQMPWAPSFLIVRSSRGDVSALVPSIRRIVAAVDADEAVGGVMSLDELMRASLGPSRVNAAVMGVFAASALLLAILGVYGVLSYSVKQRRREIGIRMALGARGSDVVRLVVGQGLRLAVLGVTVGVAAALALGRGMAGLLYGVQPADPVTLAAVACVLGVTAVGASYLPARRAARVDPATALRQA
jgi:putative ABC transport system permease protein